MAGLFGLLSGLVAQENLQNLGPERQGVGAPMAPGAPAQASPHSGPRTAMPRPPAPLTTPAGQAAPASPTGDGRPWHAQLSEMFYGPDATETDKVLKNQQLAGSIGEIGQGLATAFGPGEITPLGRPYGGGPTGPNINPGQAGLAQLLASIARG